jgi:hypothetical protein
VKLDSNKKNRVRNPLSTGWLLIWIVLAALFFLFYFKYVPLIPLFQIALVPVLILTALTTVLSPQRGILLFVFIFPLINILPYLFGIQGNTPHAPAALVLFLAFFLGWGLHRILCRQKSQLSLSIFRPLLLLGVVVTVSAVITAMRYMNFYPLGTSGIYELIVNLNGVRTGGAVMSCVMNFLNYLTGFLFFFILTTETRTRDFALKILMSLSLSGTLALVFAFIQRFVSPSLGNIRFFINIERLNATFKDPNSFGLFLSILIPLLLGLIFSSKKPIKYVYVLPLGLAFAAFPWAGSRSSMLALLISIPLFAFLALKTSPISSKKKCKILAGAGFGGVVITVALVVFAGNTNLFQRIEFNLKALSQKQALQRILDPGRMRLWQAGWSLLRAYPIAGVGLGAYIVELPNTQSGQDMYGGHTDSTENYFLQSGAELGLVGLILVLWIFIEIYRMWRSAWRSTRGSPADSFLLIGLGAAVMAVVVGFFFHSYIGAFDVKYVFWLLVALIAVYGYRPQGEEDSPVIKPKVLWMAVLLAAVYAGILLWNSTHSLSLAHTTEKYGWSQNFGFYSSEKEQSGRIFSWSQKTAGFSLAVSGNKVRIPVRAAHPGIERFPVTVQVFKADRNFRILDRISEIRLDHSRWFEIEYTLDESSQQPLRLIFQVDRVWQPKKSLDSPDTRWLGIAVGEPFFE